MGLVNGMAVYLVTYTAYIYINLVDLYLIVVKSCFLHFHGVLLEGAQLLK